MTSATLTSKGQITIPKSVRDSLHLQTGDKVDFVITQHGEALLKPVTKKVDDVFGRLHDPHREPVSVEKMNSAIGRRLQATFR